MHSGPELFIYLVVCEAYRALVSVLASVFWVLFVLVFKSVCVFVFIGMFVCVGVCVCVRVCIHVR